MYEPLVSDGTVRRLWAGETELYRQHLLRLDAGSRRNRFCGVVSDDFIRRYAEPSALRSAFIYGFFVDGVLRGAAELRLLEPAGEAEAAFSVENAWQSHGVGTELFERVLLAARDRQVKRLHEWADQTTTGDRDELVPGVPEAAWRQVSVSAQECIGAEIRRRAQLSIRQCHGRNESATSDAHVRHARARGRRHRPCDRDARRSLTARKAA